MKSLFVVFAAAAVVAAAAAGCGESDASNPAVPSQDQRVERGRYLVNAVGCADCHTPLKMGPDGPVRDASRHLSGHPAEFVIRDKPALGDQWMMGMTTSGTAFYGPWGVTYAANITPDDVTGIGIWEEQRFVDAIRLGKHWGQSRQIMPPMPWEFFRNFTDEDLKSIYAYLRTIPPVRNDVPAYEPPERKAK